MKVKQKKVLIVLEGGRTWEVLKAIKKHARLASIPLLFLYKGASGKDYRMRRSAEMGKCFRELGLAGRSVAWERFVPDPMVEYEVLITGGIDLWDGCQVLRKLCGKASVQYQVRYLYELGPGRVLWKSPLKTLLEIPWQP